MSLAPGSPRLKGSASPSQATSLFCPARPPTPRSSWPTALGSPHSVPHPSEATPCSKPSSKHQLGHLPGGGGVHCGLGALAGTAPSTPLRAPGSLKPQLLTTAPTTLGLFLSPTKQAFPPHPLRVGVRPPSRSISNVTSNAAEHLWPHGITCSRGDPHPPGGAQTSTSETKCRPQVPAAGGSPELCGPLSSSGQPRGRLPTPLRTTHFSKS